jgi:LacI family transcriptional regulator
VAREVGVAVMTVSVVLNGARSSTRVSEATRDKILEAAKRLRYRPNAVARGLSRRRMDTIGVVATIDGEDINLYFLELLNGILQGAAQHGQNTTVFSVTDWARDEQRLLHFCDGRVDGMIFISPRLSVSFLDTFSQRSPLVTIHGPARSPNLFCVDVDNENGGYIVTQHMIAHGHRRIGHIAGGLDREGSHERFEGYRRALEEAGIPFDPSLVTDSGYSMTTGRQMTAQLLERLKKEERPTAIFCASDAIASGCMEALAANGLQVPEDISVAGFDDLLLAKMTSPPLTTIRQPFRKMGNRAVELLLSQIQGVEDPNEEIGTASGEEKAVQPHTEVFDVDLIVRGSVGPPPDGPHPRPL